MTTAHNIDKIIAEQVKRWEASRPGPAAERRREPVISISRLPGCNGRALAEELARKLKFDFFGRELLHQVAESAHLSETILNTVDEKDLPMITEWIQSLFLERYLTGDYFRHLSKVLMAIAEHGRAVILGRGAGFILKPELCLRVLLVAPLEERVAVVARRDKVSRDEAMRQVVHRESERRAFIQRHFHAQLLDPVHYDMVLNTAGLGQEGALAAIHAAWENKRKQAPAGAQ
ncbi:MAG: cytidylate kinase-like family protein [Elusimicrobia bacterium]|nr:cytidylate kinase-like family protein [Elusimicrobiota bacterium]